MDQQPKRPADFFVAALMEWRCQGTLRGLTSEERIVLAAQMAGLDIAAMEVSVEAHQQFLNLAERAMRTAYFGEMKAKERRVDERRLFKREHTKPKLVVDENIPPWEDQPSS